MIDILIVLASVFLLLTIPLILYLEWKERKRRRDKKS